MKKKILRRSLFLIPLIFIFISILVVAIKGHINGNDVNFDKLGGYGGFLGGVIGTYLTFIATYYVYKTFLFQKKELKSQKKELVLQRNLIAQQQFESTFFNMLNVHRELKNGLKYSYTPLTFPHPQTHHYNGLEVIGLIKNKYINDFRTVDNTYNGINNMYSQSHEIINNIEKYSNDDFSLELSKINFSYKILFHSHQNHISHYCRNIFHILKFIRENEINETLGNDAEKYKKYANIFQSQLNVDEQSILFYNFLYFNSEENNHYSTVNLVNHYRFLENVGIENLLSRKHQAYYNFIIKGSN